MKQHFVSMNLAVPPFNHDFVHFRGTRKGTAAEADDVFMPEMRICDIIYRFSSNTDAFSPRCRC